MIRLGLALLLVLPVAAVQDKTPDEEAKEAVKEFREKRKAAKSEDDYISAIDGLKEAKPHKLILAELKPILESRLPYAVREAAADALGRHVKDGEASDSLIRRAREERGPDASNLRKQCLRSFGRIARFGKAADLPNLYADADNAVARAAVEASEKIGSVRTLRMLVALWGELDRIQDNEGGRDPGPGVPGGPGAGQDDNSRKKRKDELLDPTKGAVKSLLEKVDSTRKVTSYTEANKALGDLRAKIKEKQDEEDLADKKP